MNIENKTNCDHPRETEASVGRRFATQRPYPECIPLCTRNKLRTDQRFIAHDLFRGLAADGHSFIVLVLILLGVLNRIF